MSQNIYFDECGYTGNNLLNNDQRYFSYASVATDDVEAKEFVDRLITKYKIQGGELKGKNLVRYANGRRAIEEIITHFDGRFKLTISDKKYALACKFHEYIFEPCYSANNALFYRLGFHLFIANVLYMELNGRGAGAEEIFSEFENLMRERQEISLDNLFSSSIHPENSDVLVTIREFAQLNADAIREELSGFVGNGFGKWTLDLTKTCINTMLANWGTSYPQITAISDHSKPLQDDRFLFDAMIGKSQTVYTNIFGRRAPITYNLSAPLQFRDSKSTHGIQLADSLAAAFVYIFSDTRSDFAKKWGQKLIREAGNENVVPDIGSINLQELPAKRNLAILFELHKRAKSGKDLLEGMGEYADRVTHALRYGLIS